MPVKICGMEIFHPDYKTELARQIGAGAYFDQNGRTRASTASSTVAEKLVALHVSIEDSAQNHSANCFRLNVGTTSLAVTVRAESYAGAFYDITDCEAHSESEEHEVALVLLESGEIWAFRCDDPEYDDIFCTQSIAEGGYLPFQVTTIGELFDASLGFNMCPSEVYFGSVLMASGKLPVLLSSIDLTVAIADLPQFTEHRRVLREAALRSIEATRQSMNCLRGIAFVSGLEISQNGAILQGEVH